MQKAITISAALLVSLVCASMFVLVRGSSASVASKPYFAVSDVPLKAVYSQKLEIPQEQAEEVLEETTEPTETYTEYVEPYVEDYYEEVDYTEYDAGDDLTGDDFKVMGVVYQDGTRFTWYSENVLPGGGLEALNENGRHTDEDGFVRDGDGYIAVASSDHEQGEIVSTPFGEGKVYDSGCDSGTIDVYTGW